MICIRNCCARQRTREGREGGIEAGVGVAAGQLRVLCSSSPCVLSFPATGQLGQLVDLLSRECVVCVCVVCVLCVNKSITAAKCILFMRTQI